MALRHAIEEFLYQAKNTPSSIQANKWAEMAASIAGQTDVLMECKKDLIIFASSPQQSVRGWTCDVYLQSLQGNPGQGLSLEALEVVRVVLQQPEPPISVFQLIHACCKRTGEQQGLDGNVVSRILQIVDLLVAVRASATVTTQCILSRVVVDLLQILTSPAAKQMGSSATEVNTKVQSLIKLLVAWLRQDKSLPQPSSLTIAAINGAAILVTQRPGQAGRVLPSLTSLASSVSQSRSFSAASLQKVLRGALLSILKTESPALHAWKAKLTTALKQVGYEEPTNNAAKESQKGGDSERRSSRLKEKAQSKVGEPPKDPRSAIPLDPRLQGQPALHSQELPSAPQDPRQQAQWPPSGPQDPRLQTQWPQDGPPSDPRLQQPAGPWPQAQRPLASQITGHATQIGRPDPLNNGLPGPQQYIGQQNELWGVVSMLAGHLARDDISACLNAIEGVSPALLADIVMSMMANLPRREEIPGFDASKPSEKGGVALLSGLMQATARTEAPTKENGPAQAQQQQPKPVPETTVADSGTQAGGPGGQAKDGQQAVKAPQAAKATPLPAREIKLQAVQLDQQQRDSTQISALKRLQACKSIAVQDLRRNVITHLLPYMQIERQADRILQGVADCWDDQSYDLALGWLYSVFVATQQPKSLKQGEEEEELKSDEEEKGKELVADDEVSEQYLNCLKQLLNTLRTLLPNKDRSLAKLLLEVPALPKEVLVECLNTLLAEGSEHATLALIAARDVIMNRPANRKEALESLLGMAVSKDADLRAKTVRLVANKLFPESFLTWEIEEFARTELWKLKDFEPPPRLTTQPSLDTQTGEKRPRSDDPNLASKTTNAQTEKADGDQPAAKRPKTIEGPAKTDALPDPARLGSSLGSEPETAETAARHCELYCALCTKRHALLHELFATFGQCKGLGRAAILRNAEGLARVLGPQAPALLALVEERPPGSLPLLLKMLNFLTDSEQPPQVLLEACKQSYEKEGEAGIIAAVVAGLPTSEITKLLPKLLHPIPLLNSALHRILHSAGGPKLSPAEILLALHSINHSKEGVTLRQIMGALDHCLTWRDMFDRTVLMAVLEQLCQRATIPPLYMRFLMQSQAAVPTLKACVVQLLGSLVNKHIWTNKSLFLGWNLAIRQNVPDSFPAFLQLPPRILSETLSASPEGFQDQLKEWTDSPACPENQKGPLARLFESLKSDGTKPSGQTEEAA